MNALDPASASSLALFPWIHHFLFIRFFVSLSSPNSSQKCTNGSDNITVTQFDELFVFFFELINLVLKPNSNYTAIVQLTFTQKLLIRIIFKCGCFFWGGKKKSYKYFSGFAFLGIMPICIRISFSPRDDNLFIWKK